MKKHDLYPSLQSAYRKNHSTETALLKVTNDILMKMNSQHAVLLVLLDLSAAFDTVNHSLLLRRLQTSFGISGAPLDWFTSYLMARRQRVSIPGALSDSCSVDWGVPQGSCLGPLSYIIYSSKLFHVIERHLPDSHCYADDSQLYLSFRPDVLSSQQDTTCKIAMQNCIKDVRLWMEHDKLLLNDEKTEFLIIGTRQQLTKVNISSITVGDSDVMRSSVVKNLGVFIDDKLSMNSHVNKICNTSFCYLHNIMRIRNHLSRKSTETLIHAFVSAYSTDFHKYKLESYKEFRMQLQDLFFLWNRSSVISHQSYISFTGFQLSTALNLKFCSLPLKLFTAWHLIISVN